METRRLRAEGWVLVEGLGAFQANLSIPEGGWYNWSLLKPRLRIVALLLVVFPLRGEGSEGERHFSEKVQPLLESRCISCHGAEKQKGALRLDSREATLRGGESGPAVVAGEPEKSLLLQAVMHTKPELEMPPKEKLTAADIAVLSRWIKDGVPWSAKATVTAAAPVAPGERIGDAWSDARNPIKRIFGGQRLDLWSLQKVKRPEPPTVKNRKWVKNPIDQFILEKLEEKKLSPSPEADRRALVRRVYYDLTGLPPSAEEAEAFVQEKDPGAYERLVERLLGSKGYGEYWARQWLDVIRYSDSNGFDWDEYRPKVWRFRDYVIRSFNEDKPFDQFIREQLAGDELLEGAPKDAEEQDYLVATGYLRLGPQDNSAPLFNEQARARAELMADLVETTGSAFLGLTLSCCRCHDHKYDPLSQADHFRMRAFFEGVKYADDLPLDLAKEQEEIRKTNKEVEEEIAPLTQLREKVLAETKTKLREEARAKLSEEERQLLGRSKETCTEEERKKIGELEKKIEPEEKEVVKALGDPEKKQHAALGKVIDELRKKKRPFTTGLLMTDGEGEPGVTKIHFQGDYKSEKEAVPPGIISALDPNPAAIQKGKNPKTTGRRLTLANWIASGENPFTARVMMNRMWQGHFGRGLVETANDFGLAGAKPTHPELLDWLASEFVAQGWSMKQMHRTVVLSATYRQASAPEGKMLAGGRGKGSPTEVDAENRLYWRQNLRRVTAEQLRDGLLSVSGRLKEHAGGPPVWPELPAEILQANPAFLDDNETKTKGWYPSVVEKRDVRSVYLVQKRTVRVPFMETFDLPENSVSCARRTESVVAPQALTLLNGAEAVAAAKSLAERVQKAAGEDRKKQIEKVFEFALQRRPEREERKACEALLGSRSLAELCRSVLNANEFVYID